ncbi:MAG TPA: hypothetical protein VGB20_02910 [bacterium]
MTVEGLEHAWTPLAASLTAFVATLVLTPLVRMAAVRAGLVSRPVQDRWGRRAVARLGGVAIFFGFLAGAVLWLPLRGAGGVLMAGAGAVFLLGLGDDLRRMRPYVKLVVQLLIGCLMVLAGLRIELDQAPWLSIPLSVLWFVFVMNAFNLLDNMDGLAAGIGGMAAGFCAVHAWLLGDWTLVGYSAVLFGAALGFLQYNLPPAKIYMGDSGSHVLGLVLAALSVMGTWQPSAQLLSVLAVPVLVLAVPIFDTLFVTIQRLRHGQHPFVGGTDHVSHRLAILGLSTRQTMGVLYLLSASLGALSILAGLLNALPVLALGLFTIAVLLLLGRYLSRVKVYRIAAGAAVPAEARAVRVTRIDTILLHKRRLFEILADFLLLSAAYVLAYLLRFEGGLNPPLSRQIAQSLPLILVIKIACFAVCGLYRGLWRYVSLADLVGLVRTVTLASMLSALAVLFLWRFEGYSRAVFVIDWMITLLAVAGARVTERLLDEWIRRAASGGTPVLVVGAGDVGAAMLRSLRSLHEGPGGLRVVGVLDDDPDKLGSRIHGVPVLGSREDLEQAISAWRVQTVFVAIADPPADLLEHIRRGCEPRGVAWRVVSSGLESPV